ncbi:DEAD/DEAH box helicase, partial [Vibrio jasicida]
NEELWFNLRRCQKESINKSIDYSKSVLDDKNKSCLISLPTGAGKSGVISVVSHTVNQNKILVLCHRRAVCNQLYAEINGKFFREKAPNGTHSLKKVYNKIDDTDADGIYVSTFQKLQRFTKLQLDKLKKDIDLVIVDEGHAEPSPVWRTLVRGMNAHKIVITATPYRNDLFQF